MANPLSALLQKSGFMRRLAGIAEDFWKDPACEFPSIKFTVMGKTLSIPNLLCPLPPGTIAAGPIPEPIPARNVAVAATPMTSMAMPPPAAVPRWHAAPGELAEKMWGAGHILPVGNALMDILIAPLKLTRDKNVLDLTAGLGTLVRHMAPLAGELKGVEADPSVASRGMELSVQAGKAKIAPIAHYDPDTFSMPAIYDCMIAREIFYRVADKNKFFYSIGAGIKIHGQTSFTDYIVDPENRDKPAILKWQEHEKNAHPLGLIEMAEAWARVGFEMRKSEDQTAFYRREIVNGFNRFVTALRQGPPADAETKAAILTEVETWIFRLAAIQQGLKFYVFHAVKS